MCCQTRHHQSALFALWKALQYQFIIEQYAQVVQSSEKNETPLMIKKCYALHTFYLREAYAIHLESVLAAPTPDASLSVSFLHFADFASEKEYCEVYEVQVRVGGEGGRGVSESGFDERALVVVVAGGALCERRVEEGGVL